MSKKRLAALVIMFSMILCSINVSASDIGTIEDSTIVVSSVEETGETMLNNYPAKDPTILMSDDLEISPRAVTSEKFVTNYNNFTRYYTTSFSQGQYNTNCVPTLVANVLSYYKTGRWCPDLYSGTITQSFYNEICDAVGYSPASGSNLKKATDGLKTLANKTGYKCIVDSFLFNTWGNLTSSIDSDLPLMLGFNDHAYLALGYRIIDGQKQVYVFTNWSSQEYMWLNFQSGMEFRSVNIYYY